MLTKLHLQNFHCFENHTIPIRPCTIIVGRNNAGKSTIVDALRLVSIVTSRYQALHYSKPPNWGDIPRREIGVSPSIKGMEFNAQNIFHRYGEPPAVITAHFENGAAIKIYVGLEAHLHAVIFSPDGSVVRDNRAAKKRGLLPKVEIMPQVAPLEKNEYILGADYVRANLSSAIAPKHFRNQLNLLQSFLPSFRTLAEETWHGLQVKNLSGSGGKHGDLLSLMIRNEDYVAEVATMGHGLQMWLQTMWFLARIDPSATVILDEPDVYMHPDLQRRLLRYLRNSRKQLLVTTHSVEIMSEVTPEETLVIDRRHEESQFASSFPAVQKILEHVGSAQNVQLARLWNARKCILVEGTDFRIISDLFDVLYPEDQDGLSLLPNMSIGGWGGWQYAIGSSMLLRNSGGEHIAVYCLFDSDYHTTAQKANRYQDAKRVDVQLHIWQRKEIENYLISPNAIQRLINSRIARRTTIPTLEEINLKLEDIFTTLKDEAFDAISAELLAETRGLGAGGANKNARIVLDEAWKSYEGRSSIVSGKSVLSQLSYWAQEQFGVSMTPAAIARAMLSSDIPPEMIAIIKTIASGRTFDSMI